MSDEKNTQERELDLGLLREVYSETEKPQAINVLVVEDSDEDFFLITRCLNTLSDFDVSISRANDAKAASRISTMKDIDLAIVDYWLGEDTGPQVLAELGGRHGSCPAILVTGLGHSAYKHAALKAGAIQSLSKDQLTADLLQDAIHAAFMTHKVERDLLDGAA